MRRVLTTTDASHPDTPAPEAFSHAGALVWQVYIDGVPFIGVPAGELGAPAKVEAYAAQIVATGRYEYVDVRLRPERRMGARRATQPRRLTPTREATDVGGRRRSYKDQPRRRFDNPLDQSRLARDCTPWLAS